MCEKNNTKPAVESIFHLVSKYEGMDEMRKAEIEEELGDLDEEGGIDCRRIKLPSGKSKAFEVESDNPDDPDMEKELKGIVLFTHRMNARWEGEYSGENRLPACSSWDAKQGVEFETGETHDCDACPYNAFQENGKECKNTRRIYLMLDGKPHLYLLTVPPTSLRSVGKQLKRILSGGTPLTRTVVTFKLESAVSKGGKDYARITVEKAGELTQKQGDLARQMREEIKGQYTSVAVENADYAGAESTPAQKSSSYAGDPTDIPTGEFMNIPDGIEDDGLPFN